MNTSVALWSGSNDGLLDNSGNEVVRNNILKVVFRRFHIKVIQTISVPGVGVIDRMWSNEGITPSMYDYLKSCNPPSVQYRELLRILHTSKDPTVFIKLLEAIEKEDHKWLVKEIDDEYHQLLASAPAAAQLEVARVHINSSLAPHGQNRLIENSVNYCSTPPTEISRLVEENARLKGEKEQLSRETASLTTKNSRKKVKWKDEKKQLSSEIVALKTENSLLKFEINRLRQKRSSKEIRMVVFDPRLDGVMELHLKKLRIESGEDENIEMWISQVASTATDCVITSKLTDEDSATGVSELRYLLEQPQDMWSTYDVLEPILLLVAVKLFIVNGLCLLLPHRADVTTLVTVSSVCRDWWKVIMGRKFLRRRLRLTFRKSTVLPVELFKAAVLQRNRLSDQPHKSSRDADVIVLQSLASVCRRWKAAFSGSGDIRRRRLKRLFRYNPQLLVTLNEPTTDIGGCPRCVVGVVLLDTCLCVVYSHYNKVEVFDCEENCKKVKDIEVEGMKSPVGMVGCSVRSQLFIVDCHSLVIWQVNVNTGVSDVFNKPGYMLANLSLVENRLLVTSRDSLLMYDIHSGQRIKNISLPGNIKEEFAKLAIESNRDSFFVSYGASFYNNAVSEIDSEGRVIRVFDNKQLFDCGHLALDSFGRLLVADCKNKRVAVLDGHLKYGRVIFDNRRLCDAEPYKLSYNKNNNRLAVGLNNGQVKIFEGKGSL